MYYAFFENENSNHLSIVQSTDGSKPFECDVIFQNEDIEAVKAFKKGFENGDRNPVDGRIHVAYNNVSWLFTFFNGKWILHQIIDGLGVHEFALGDDAEHIKYVKPENSASSAMSYTEDYRYGCYIPYENAEGLRLTRLPAKNVKDEIIFKSNNINELSIFCYAYFDRYYHNGKWREPKQGDILTKDFPAQWQYKFTLLGWRCIKRPYDSDPNEDYTLAPANVISRITPDTLKIEDIKHILAMNFISDQDKLEAIKSVINFN